MARLQGAMPQWMADGNAALSANGTAFDQQLDPSMNMLDPSAMNFMPNSATPFDLQGFPQQQQLPQHMGNGTIRNASPAFQTPAYQVPPSSIPSKRPRQREDSLGASPHQTPGAPPASRSETPQQVPYGQFPGGQPPQQQFAQQNPYQHLQHGGSANASPSPIMQNQQFRGAGATQRVQTASPSPFSPAAQGYGQQISPAQQDPTGRIATPQNAPPGYVQGLQYGQGFNPNFTQQPGSAVMPAHNMAPQQMMFGPNQQQQEMQRNYHMQLAQQRQQMMKVRGIQQQGPVNQMGPQQAQPGAAGPKASPPRSSQGAQRNMNPENFVKTIVAFMSGRGQRINPQPVIGDRPINLMHFYFTVVKRGGSKRVTQSGGWASVAADLQFAPAQYPTAPQELKEIFERTLAAYEEAWIQTQQRQRMMAGGGMMPGPQNQTNDVAAMPQQMSPTKPQGPVQNLNQAMPSAIPQAQTQPKPPNPAQGGNRSFQVNGVAQGKQNVNHNRQQSGFSSARPMSSQSATGGIPQTVGASIPISASKDEAIIGIRGPTPQLEADPSVLLKQEAAARSNFEPRAKVLETYGGLDLNFMIAHAQDVLQCKPTYPRWPDLGIVDIGALSLSLQSNLHAEVRNALDTLVVLSEEQRINQGIHLSRCEDLLASLIDCAEVQLDTLAEHSLQSSEDAAIVPYEEVFRSWRLEKDTIQDIPSFGSTEYELDKAAERLICITTILRNFSFHQHNHPKLADSSVVKLLSKLIQHLGTKKNLFRNSLNTADIMKDLVTFFSNVSQQIELPGKDEGLAILHFLLAFAACPPPKHVDGKPILFTQYDFRTHRYLPAAVDSLAKILARDEPNRTIYKSVFHAESLTSTPYDLLTKTFALAISPIPEFSVSNLGQIVEMRKPLLMQGMLAAEVLSSFAPGYESGVARSWLLSEDGFATSLVRLVTHVSKLRGAPPPQRHARPEDHDLQTYSTITQRGLVIIRRLAEKAQNMDDPTTALPTGILPKREVVLGSLLTQSMDAGVLKQLCSFSNLEV